MKHLTITLLAMLIAIGGCSKEVPKDQLVERGGVYYEINSSTPFSGTTLWYHNNGQLRQEANYKDGKPDGLVTVYFENGQLRYKTEFTDGELDGLYEVYTMNGQLVDKRTYKDGVEISN